MPNRILTISKAPKDLGKAFENLKQRPRVEEADSILELDIKDIQDLIEQEQQIRETAIKKTEDKRGRKVMRSNKTFELINFA